MWKVLISVNKSSSNFKCLLFVNFHNSFCSTNVKSKARCQGCSSKVNALPCPGVSPTSSQLCRVYVTSCKFYRSENWDFELWGGLLRDPNSKPILCATLHCHTSSLKVSNLNLLSPFPYLFLLLFYPLRVFIFFPPSLSTFLSLEMNKGHHSSSSSIIVSDAHIQVCFYVGCSQ